MSAQAPILTITLNPALDVTTGTAEVVPGRKLRCEPPMIDAGGGGVNVSRAIAIMGGRSTAMVALGGATGHQLAQILASAQIPIVALPAPGDTRQSLTVHDHCADSQYRFVLPGPTWAQRDVDAALALARQHADCDGLVIISGSNPPGVPAEFAMLLADRLADCGAKLIVDTSGPALAALAARTDRRVNILRMDDIEADGLAGRKLDSRADTADFAARLVASGAAAGVIVARDTDGNIIATAQGIWHAEAAKVPIVSKVGAGDSFLAGFVLGHARGWPEADSLGLAAAAASAAVQTPATELCRAEDVQKLFGARVVTRIG